MACHTIVLISELAGQTCRNTKLTHSRSINCSIPRLTLDTIGIISEAISAMVTGTGIARKYADSKPRPTEDACLIISQTVNTVAIITWKTAIGRIVPIMSVTLSAGGWIPSAEVAIGQRAGVTSTSTCPKLRTTFIAEGGVSPAVHAVRVMNSARNATSIHGRSIVIVTSGAEGVIQATDVAVGVSAGDTCIVKQAHSQRAAALLTDVGIVRAHEAISYKAPNAGIVTCRRVGNTIGRITLFALVNISEAQATIGHTTSITGDLARNPEVQPIPTSVTLLAVSHINAGATV